MKHTLHFLILWLCISCSPTRTQRSEQLHTHADTSQNRSTEVAMQHDSALLHRSMHEKIYAEQMLLSHAEAIAENETSLIIPLTAVPLLPEGAAYIAREGRTAVQITRHGDSIRITGRSESVPRERVSMQMLRTQSDHETHALDISTSLRTDSAASVATVTSRHNTSSRIEHQKAPSTWLKVITWLIPALAVALMLGWRHLRRR